MDTVWGVRLLISLAFVGFIEFFFVAIPSSFSQTYQSTPATAGFRDFNYDGGGVNNEPTEEKPESKLWYHDGYWWGVLWDPAPGEHTFKIHRFDPSTQNWTIIGTEVDGRRRSAADALWDGTKLYIASRAKETHKDSEGPETAILNRYTYHSDVDSFSLDPGFPVDITGSTKTRALTIAKDSNGKIWAVWTNSNRVHVNSTTTDDQNWGTTFELPGQGNDLADIDLASIIAFGGDKVGILWGNQLDEKYYFAVHQDVNADTVWDAREEALADSVLPAIADDHINLACHTADGTLVAAVKTSTNGSANPRIFVLKRDPLTGSWSRHLFGVGADDHTRPIALINSETDSVYVFARAKDEDAIIMKAAHLESLDFPQGTGTHIIDSVNDPAVNNPTSTKQCVTNQSGILVLATTKDTKYYLHGFIGFYQNSAPVAGADSYNVDEDSTLIVAAPGILGNDTDADGDTLTASVTAPPASGLLTLNGDGSFSYVPNTDFNGLDSFVYTAYDARDSSTATVTLQVNSVNDPPVALDDSYAVPEDSTLVVPAPGVLSNDIDADTLTVAITTPASNGLLSLNGDGSFSYTPDVDFNGLDSFVYTA
ncbi:cadherin-like domain-containing protein, partial [bacterium]|nr:cadherin-like domain-containing protein [bacterium]